MKRALVLSLLTALLGGCVVAPYGYHDRDDYHHRYGYRDRDDDYHGHGYYHGGDYDRGYGYGYGYRDRDHGS